MENELPTEFDLIVIGTGVVESVISAAASRVGQRVLHIDTNNYYGGLWASFNLEQLLKQFTQSIEPSSYEAADDLLPLGNDYFHLKDFHFEWQKTAPTGDIATGDELKEPTWTKETILKESRKFNLDLCPKLQFARGEFVELLISSNIARYSEYRSVSRVLTHLNGELEIVPCSRSDVFANNKVSVIEKRMLMKLLTSLEEIEADLDENKTFVAFLKEKKLTPNLIHYVLYAISMSDKQTLCKEGVKSTKRFMNSLGRFGKTPFLFSMYGSGEITQAFCRLSAVFGGIYALNQKLTHLIVDETNKKRVKGVICGKQKIYAEKVILSVEKVPNALIQKPNFDYISRAIFITDGSILPSEKEHLTLLLYPPEGKQDKIVVVELGGLTGTCPNGLYLVHLITKQVISPVDDFQQCKDFLFEGETKPKLLLSVYFSIPNSNDLNLDFFEANCKACPGPDLDLDYDLSILKAKQLFGEIYPDLEFLPRAPDPEEIIIGGDEEQNCDGGELNTEIKA